ncbi:MAG: class I lanthipeptide [Acidobacteria bacterium]|jgi:hypothetical protein|nr:class I lanthipeptide [Acidobacteriota bacterium]
MKTKNFNKKMVLNKETIANLGSNLMNKIKGGVTLGTSAGDPACYCDSIKFCSCPKACPN